MKKGINIVVLGVLTLVSVILALPFTPLRSSFKGVATNAADKALTSFGVDLNGKIQSARLIAKSHEYESNNFIVEDKNVTKYMRQGKYSELKGLPTDESYIVSAKQEASQPNAGMPGELSAPVSARSNVTKMGGFVAVSIKMTAQNKSTSTDGSTKQNGNGQNNGTGGATHPGVDPTPLPSLPLGNGFLCLLSLALIYVSFKEWN